MNLSVQDIIEDVKPNTGSSGTCDNEDAIRYINRAQELLIFRLDSKGTIACRCREVRDNCFSIDPFVSIRQMLINGRNVTQRDYWWEGSDRAYGLNYGYGWDGECGRNEVVDGGDGFALPIPLRRVANAKLAFSAESEEDAGKSIHVDLIDPYGTKVGEDITLPRDMAKVYTTSDVVDMVYFHKPITKGSVKVYHVGPTGAYTLEAVYRPHVQNPSYRRQRIPLHWYNRCANVILKGKVRYEPVVDLTDQLIIGNRNAIIWAVKAVTAQTIGNVEDYNNFLSEAVNELLQELRDDESDAVVAPMHVETGVSFNRQIGGRYNYYGGRTRW